MTTERIVWEEPGPASHHDNSGKGRWQQFVAELRDHPGQWALADQGLPERKARELAGNLSRTHLVEAVSRVQEDRTCKVYARWPAESR